MSMSTMDTVYMGPDAEFVYRLDQRLADEGLTYRIRIHRPDTSVAEHATCYVVEVESSQWRRALESCNDALAAWSIARERQVAIAQAFAADQASKRGRMEVTLIISLVLGGVVGFMSYPMVVEPNVCPWAPPVLLESPAQALPVVPPSNR